MDKVKVSEAPLFLLHLQFLISYDRLIPTPTQLDLDTLQSSFTQGRECDFRKFVLITLAKDQIQTLV